MKKTGTLFSAIAMLGISIVALTTASFAWFSASSTATVDGVTATIKGGSSLVINTKYADVAGSALTEYSSKITLGATPTLDAVMPTIEGMATRPDAARSSKVVVKDHGLTFNRLDDASKYSADAASPVHPVAANYLPVTSPAFFVQDLYIKAEKIPQGQVLDVSLDVKETLAKSFIKTGESAVVPGAKAARLGFVVMKATGEGAFDPADDGTAFVYEPFAANDNITQPSGAGDPTYHDVNRICAADSTANGANIKLFTLTRTTDSEVSKEIYCVRFYLWIDGNDEDCEDWILNETFPVSLAFVGNAVNPTT